MNQEIKCPKCGSSDYFFLDKWSIPQNILCKKCGFEFLFVPTLRYKYVIAFDCDGTLDVSGGRVSVEDLFELTKRDNMVIIVSPSPACASLPFPKVNTKSREENLMMVKHLYYGKQYFYISDNPGDDTLSVKCGFTYIHPNSFDLTKF